MAFILVLTLLKSEAHSSMQCQIVLLHVQSNRRTSNPAMQALHDVCQNFVIYFRRFRLAARTMSYFCPAASDFASAKLQALATGGAGKPLADVPFSC